MFEWVRIGTKVTFENLVSSTFTPRICVFNEIAAIFSACDIEQLRFVNVSFKTRFALIIRKCWFEVIR